MKEITLTKGYVALVDDEDYERVAQFKWYALVTEWVVYAYRVGPRPERECIPMHRFILGAPSSMDVDHKNHNGLDNRRSNIRICTIRQNHGNLRRPRHNTSGYKGVTRFKRDGNWRAYIKLGGKQKHLGYFSTAEEAARVYDAAAWDYFGEFAILNFPPKAA